MLGGLARCRVNLLAGAGRLVAPDLPPLTLALLRSGETLDQNLLRAARLHVGAAGIEQTAALERLIAAGKEHTGLVQALEQVTQLLEQAGETPSQRLLLRDSRELSLVLNELARVVTTALEQITATPVQRISAQRLSDIADQTRQHMVALEELINAAEESRAVPDDVTPDLEAVLRDLRTRTMQIRAEQHQGRIQTLGALIAQAADEIKADEASQVAQRVGVLRTAQAELERHLAALEQQV